MKKIVYEWADGTKTTIEVEDKWADFVEDSRRKEENYERKMRYWNKVSLDSCEYQGDWFESSVPTPEEAYFQKEQEEKVEAFIATLTSVQKRRLQYKLDDPMISFREIARLEGTNLNAIGSCFECIKKKYKKFFEEN